jgi:branched-subunit amino acid ABC-type transport system permease component
MTMSLPVLSGQLLVGLINGSFYAILSLGLSIIFGLLGIVNLTQGAFYMVGAFFAWMLLQWLGVGYWGALILAPLGVAAIGAAGHESVISAFVAPPRAVSDVKVTKCIHEHGIQHGHVKYRDKSGREQNVEVRWK